MYYARRTLTNFDNKPSPTQQRYVPFTKQPIVPHEMLCIVRVLNLSTSTVHDHQQTRRDDQHGMT